jgi:tRNA-2-methylthio-N6-dimethylallyladenosine synthase
MLDQDTKVHDESRQGEAFAPEAAGTQTYSKKFYIESYGCAMNFNDSEIVASILNQEGYGATRNVEEASLILLNTCSIREKAEQTVRKRLTEFRSIKRSTPGLLVGVLGCMAERIKGTLEASATSSARPLPIAQRVNEIPRRRRKHPPGMLIIRHNDAKW